MANETLSIEQKQAAEWFFNELATLFGRDAVGDAAWVHLNNGKSIEFCTMVFDAAMVHLSGTNMGEWLKSDYEYACQRIKGEVE